MRKKVWKVAFGALVVVLLLGGTAFGAILWSIQGSVQENCQVAQQAHPHSGDHVSALIVYMKSSEHSLQERSHKAVWTLGRLRDPKALPALRAAYTGKACDHGVALCQHELKKAIRRCGGDPTIRSNGSASIL